jgi:hypothetical protein
MLRHGCGYAFANAFRTGSGIAGSSAPCVTLSYRPQGLGTFGADVFGAVTPDDFWRGKAFYSGCPEGSYGLSIEFRERSWSREGPVRKSKKTVRREPPAWEVYRLKGSPSAFVGVVYADDKADAIAAAIREDNNMPSDQKRLLARPR